MVVCRRDDIADRMRMVGCRRDDIAVRGCTVLCWPPDIADRVRMGLCRPPDIADRGCMGLCWRVDIANRVRRLLRIRTDVSRRMGTVLRSSSFHVRHQRGRLAHAAQLAKMRASSNRGLLCLDFVAGSARDVMAGWFDTAPARCERRRGALQPQRLRFDRGSLHGRLPVPKDGTGGALAYDPGAGSTPTTYTRKEPAPRPPRADHAQAASLSDRWTLHEQPRLWVQFHSRAHGKSTPAAAPAVVDEHVAYAKHR